MTNDLNAIRARMEALEGFTAGPWEERTFSHFIEIASLSEDAAICQVLVMPGTYEDTDARLIAAAPDMHATILSLYDEMERLRGLLDRRGVGKAERYWEGRWRDEKAENDRLIAAFKRIEDAGIGGFLTPDLVAEITLEALGQEEDA